MKKGTRGKKQRHTGEGGIPASKAISSLFNREPSCLGVTVSLSRHTEEGTPAPDEGFRLLQPVPHRPYGQCDCLLIMIKNSRIEWRPQSSLLSAGLQRIVGPGIAGMK